MKTNKKLCIVLVVLAICLVLGGSIWAAEDPATFEATIDGENTICISDEDRTIAVTVKASKEIEAASFSALVMVPDGWSFALETPDVPEIKETCNGNQILWFGSIDSTETIENVPMTNLVTITYTVPEGVTGNFDLGLSDVELYKVIDGDTFEMECLADQVTLSVTLTINEHADGDADGDHNCDLCGKAETTVCGDNQKNHVCDTDSRCTVYNEGNNAHVDGDDDDHLCDYGCGDVADDGCHDADNDGNHKCDECGEEGVTNHEYEAVVTDPTCTAGGYTTHTCSECGDSYVDTYVDALGHTEVVDEAVEPTCTETGLTEGKHCSVCDEVLVAQETVDALGHDYDAVVTDPTCTEKGYTTHTCSECGDTYTDSEVAAKGHTEEVDEAVEPTCTETGLTEGKHCSVCGETIVAQEIVDALGHTEGEIVVENNVAADCENSGSYDNVVYCTVCDAELSRTTVTVDALGHSYTGEIRNDGETHSFKCVNGCGGYGNSEDHDFTNGDCACGEEKPAYTVLKGDINLDGEVDMLDLVALARHVGEVEFITSDQALASADVNEDGEVDMLDLVKHAQYIGEIITDWNVN